MPNHHKKSTRPLTTTKKSNSHSLLSQGPCHSLALFMFSLRLIRPNIVSFLKLVRKKFRNIVCCITMSHPTSEPELQNETPPFDPTKPSVPISYPIKTLEELESRSYFESFHYPFNKASVALQSGSSSLPNRRRLLVCHDMSGGYLDDKWIQGGTNPNSYSIWHWYLIDVFVYFSHNLVTLPPPCWTNTAHRHGVKVYQCS
jgi:mannosyl-glycoprotein endo-beta-N-acetylglucosaminidase